MQTPATPASHDGAFLMYAGETPRTEARKITVGFAMYITTDVMLALMFFIGYMWLRQYNTSGLWYPPGVQAPSSFDLLWPTVALIISSLAYAGAQYAVRIGNLTLMRALLIVAFLIMVAVMVWEIIAMGHLPMTTTDGSFAAAYLLLIGYHIFHLMVAVLIGIGIVAQSLRGRFTREGHVGLDVAGIWWYWVAAYSVLFWLLILTLPPALNYH